MKQLTVLLTIAAMMLAASCNKVEVEFKTLDYRVSVAELATKTIGDGTTVDKMVYAIFDGETQLKKDVLDRSEDGTFSFSPSFYYGKEYTVVFFAYKDGAYNVESVTAISKLANGENADAFTHKETVKIDHNGELYVDGIHQGLETEHPVVLKRPLAQLIIATEETVGATKIRVALTAPNTYNTFSTQCSEPADAGYVNEVENLGLITVSDKDYTVVSCNYLFPTVAQTVIVQVLNKSDEIIRTIILDNVPLVANKKTQIYGNLVKGELTFTVSLSTEFDETDGEDNPIAI